MPLGGYRGATNTPKLLGFYTLNEASWLINFVTFRALCQSVFGPDKPTAGTHTCS